MAGKRAPLISHDEALWPTWLFGTTVHEGCDRGGYYEQGQFGEKYGSPQCMRFRLLFRVLVCTRKEVIGQIHVCDAKLRRMNLPKKLSDFLNMSSVLQAELRSAGSQSMAYGVLDLYHGEYVEFD
jgi:hypothetical protein